MTKPDGGESGGSVLRLEDVSRSYQMGMVEVKALSGVSLEVPGGEFIVILGPSGSGKTTLLNLVGGIDSPTSGRISVGGLDITTLDEKGLTSYRRNHVGFVFQFFNLLPTLTARGLSTARYSAGQTAPQIDLSPSTLRSYLHEAGSSPEK